MVLEHALAHVGSVKTAITAIAICLRAWSRLLLKLMSFIVWLVQTVFVLMAIQGMKRLRVMQDGRFGVNILLMILLPIAHH